MTAHQIVVDLRVDGVVMTEEQAGELVRSIAAEYHRGGKEAFERVVNEWPVNKEKVQTWANNCSVYERQHRSQIESK